MDMVRLAPATKYTNENAHFLVVWKTFSFHIGPYTYYGRNSMCDNKKKNSSSMANLCLSSIMCAYARFVANVHLVFPFLFKNVRLEWKRICIHCSRLSLLKKKHRLAMVQVGIENGGLTIQHFAAFVNIFSSECIIKLLYRKKCPVCLRSFCNSPALL